MNSNEKINNSSADLLIKKLINPTAIKKISFYPEKFSASVFLNGKYTGDVNESNVFEEKLGHLSYKTGWSIAISDKVNQNELFNIAKLLCDKNEIVLKKNPSYNPGNMTISLNIISGEENFYTIKEEFDNITGCSLVIN